MTRGAAHTDLLMEMLSIPAPSRQEKKRADFLESVLKGMGHRVQRIHHNLLVGGTASGARGRRILLNSHMDTVLPVNGWSSDPHVPQRDGDRIVGLGSNDAAASVVAMIAVFDRMKDELEDTMDLLLLISAEEEISGEAGIASVIPHAGKLDGVIVGEPTAMKVAVAERGLMVLDGEVKGTAGHAARSEGINAINLAMQDIAAIAALRFPDSSRWLPAPGAQVTMIQAGTVHNVVPDLCRYVVDVRSNDRYGNEMILEMIRSVCSAELNPRSTRLRPSCLDGDHFLMEAVSRSGLQPYGSSTLSDMALLPVPAIKMGPGDPARSHTADEYIMTGELEQGIEVYGLYLRTLAALFLADKKP